MRGKRLPSDPNDESHLSFGRRSENRPDNNQKKLFCKNNFKALAPLYYKHGKPHALGAALKKGSELDSELIPWDYCWTIVNCLVCNETH